MKVLKVLMLSALISSCSTMESQRTPQNDKSEPFLKCVTSSYSNKNGYSYVEKTPVTFLINYNAQGNYFSMNNLTATATPVIYDDVYFEKNWHRQFLSTDEVFDKDRHVPSDNLYSPIPGKKDKFIRFSFSDHTLVDLMVYRSSTYIGRRIENLISDKRAFGIMGPAFHYESIGEGADQPSGDIGSPLKTVSCTVIGNENIAKKLYQSF